MDDLSIANNNNPVSVSDAVRAHRGLSPINPNKIEGFGPEDPPMPSYTNPFPPIERPDPMEADFHAPEQSPLIPADFPTPTQVWKNPDIAVPANPTVTWGEPQRDYLEIWYQGSKVAVSGQLQLDVERLILQGLQKEINEKLNMLKPRRERRAKVSGTVTPAPVAVKQSRKGRPKGSLNKKTLEKLKQQGAHVPVVDHQAS